MAVQRTPMTRGGYEKLKEELERLKRVERHAITKAIAEARAHGDLSENAEYHAARERQSFVDRKSTRLNSSHLVISYAVFCLKKKKKKSTLIKVDKMLATKQETSNVGG